MEGIMRTKICVPIMGRDSNEIIKQAEQVLEKKPDMVELRADGFDEISPDMVVEITKKVKEVLGKIELIFTLRTKREGGECEINESQYKEICVSAASVCHYVDVEIIGHLEIAEKIVSEIHNQGAKVIGSSHYFDHTPDNEKIIEIMKKMEGVGADICKIAVMPQDKEDVERLIQVSARLKNIISTPIITMSMGELGSVTRVCTAQTGSCVTFAVGVHASAPGQIDVDMARKLLKVNQGCGLKGNIILIGFMGTGKTTVSKALSRITGFKEIDVDAYIVEKQGKSISEIFESKGEEYFRKLETNTLKEVSEKSGQIISCGGGAVLKDENVDILKKRGVIVLLTATPETIFDRVKDHTHRPILNRDMSLKHVRQLMAEREPRYKEVADVKISVDANDRILTCYNILTVLEEMGYVHVN